MRRRLQAAKVQIAPVPVSDALYHLLLWRDWHGARLRVQPDDHAFELFALHRYQRVWAQIQDVALLDWIAVVPGRRPASWWYWTAPDLRRLYGRFNAADGITRCHPTGIPYGTPADWQDLPMCESEAAYLDRHDLWLAGEREQVPLAAFDAEVFSWALTNAQMYMPRDEDEAIDIEEYAHD
jgi:hypothetical protein